MRNLWRSRTYLRPYYGQYIRLILAGAAATGVSIAIPYLAQRVVDGPVAAHDSSGLWLLGALALAFGLIESTLNFYRRWAQAGSALGMETALRNDLYAHLQRLPVAFHDGWQSGQLLSRVTSDLSAMRRFLSFGLIFLVINGATFVTVIVLLLRIYWPLGLVVAASAVPLFIISARFTTRYNAMSRRMQDEQGDVATLAEETAAGIRVVKAFGRREHMSARFDERIRKLRGTAVAKTVMVARTWSTFDLVPATTLAIVLVGGAVAVSAGQHDPGPAGRLRHAAADADLADRLAGIHHRQRPGGDDRGRPDLRGARHDAEHRRPAGRHPAGHRGRTRGGPVRRRRVQLSRGAATGAARHRPRGAPGRDPGHRRRDRHPARRPWCRWSRA